MEYMAVAQGQGITPHSFKHYGGQTRFYMRLEADKLSADCTWQIECKVVSSYWGLLLSHSVTAVVSLRHSAVPGMYCRPSYQSAGSVGCLWHVCLRCAAVPCHHWFIEGQLSFKITYQSWQFHRPTSLSSYYKKHKLWHCHAEHKP